MPSTPEVRALLADITRMIHTLGGASPNDQRHQHLIWLLARCGVHLQHSAPSATQPKKHSFLEACANVTVGYMIALTTQIILFWALDIPVSFSQNLLIGVVFTLISLVRTYYVRRLFNWWQHEA